MRLNKFISGTGRCSRREADELIAAGRVSKNGARADVGTVVEDGDEIRIDGELVTAGDRPERVYLALHKPVGIVCTTDRSEPDNIVDFVDHPERVFPIGRLDKDSEGLILLTNDGDLVNEVLRVEHGHDKEYVVEVDRTLAEDDLAQLARGVRIDPGSNPTGTTVMTRPCVIEKLAARAFRIVLTQGLNRQIRKMCELFGYQVVALRRVRIMHIELGHLKVGRWRNLTEGEVAALVPAERARPPRGPSPSSSPSPSPSRSPSPSPSSPPSPSPSPSRSPSPSPSPSRSPSPSPAQARKPPPPAKPKPKPIPFGQPGAPGGPPLPRPGRGGRPGGGRPGGGRGHGR